MLQALELKAITVKTYSFFLQKTPQLHTLERKPKKPLKWEKQGVSTPYFNF